MLFIGVTVLKSLVKFQATFMTFLIFAGVPLVLLVFSSLISYILLLLFMVILILTSVNFFYSLRGLLVLVIVTVYVGAMITLFVYVRAVSPNDYSKPARLALPYLLILITLILGLVVQFLGDIPLVESRLYYTSYEIFSGFGLVISIFLTGVLLIILLISTYRTPSLSTFRSLK